MKCEKCEILFELYDQVEKTNRNYWLMTELFVMIHDGKDECGEGFHPVDDLVMRANRPLQSNGKDGKGKGLLKL